MFRRALLGADNAALIGRKRRHHFRRELQKIIDQRVAFIGDTFGDEIPFVIARRVALFHHRFCRPKILQRRRSAAFEKQRSLFVKRNCFAGSFDEAQAFAKRRQKFCGSSSCAVGKVFG